MTLWAFLLCVAYIPGVTGWMIQSGWAYISLTVPWMGWRQPSRLPRWVIVLGLVGFAYAVFSLSRLGVWWVGLEQIWMLACLGLVAWLVSKIGLGRMSVGLAYGLYVGVAVALIQFVLFHWWGRDWAFIARFDERPAGLFYNAIIFGNACAVVGTLLICQGRYFLASPLALGLVLSGSRGAAISLVVAMIAWLGQERRRLLLAIPALCAAPFAWIFFHPGESDVARAVVWRNIWLHLSWLGYGPGALEETVLYMGGRVLRVEYAHNELLDLAYSYGIGSVPFILLLIAPLARIGGKEWPAYVCFFTTCLWAFPLHFPVEASIGVSLASALYCGFRLPRPDFSRWGLGVGPFLPLAGGRGGRALGLPDQTRHLV